MFHILFTYSFVAGHLAGFHLFVIMNGAAMNFHVQGIYLAVGLLGHMIIHV